MLLEDKYKITSEDYFDIFINYNGNMEIIKQYEKFSVQIMNPGYAVIYLPASQISRSLIGLYGYNAIPKCYALTDETSLEASGIKKLRGIPAFNLRGKGVFVGIIDTGIDYMNPLFQNKDGTTRISAIWDQTIDSEEKYPQTVYPVYYGTEYTKEEINEAIKSLDPFQIVPSIDTNGHGTMLAGIAAGGENKQMEFSGVVPEADILVVKLKQAKKNIREFYSIPLDVNCYEEDDIIWGIQYLIDTARKMKQPLAICIGLGTSQGAHDNSGVLNTIVSLSSDFPGIAVSIAGGNEGNSRRHFYSALDPDASVSVEINVGEEEKGFTMEFWGNPPMIYTIDILSPNGEYIPEISKQLQEARTIRFIFEETIININNILIEADTGKQLIILDFINPTQGTWKLEVYGESDLKGAFNIWLPSDNFISPNTYFLNPNEYTTITSPGNCITPITVTAYNPNSGAIYPNAGKGYSTSNIINPDLTAPGINIKAPTLNQEFTTITGTSAAAAHMAGITAMLLEWGIVKNNYPDLDTIGIKKYLIRGAERNTRSPYPNRVTGYGIVDIFNAYNIFRTD